jgi:DNA-binding beta-propeller fold protein YncE
MTQAQSEFTSPTAVYKGLAIASNSHGTFIYAANFHDGTVDVFDKNFKPTTLSGSFTDPNIPPGLRRLTSRSWAASCT